MLMSPLYWPQEGQIRWEAGVFRNWSISRGFSVFSHDGTGANFSSHWTFGYVVQPWFFSFIYPCQQKGNKSFFLACLGAKIGSHRRSFRAFAFVAFDIFRQLDQESFPERFAKVKNMHLGSPQSAPHGKNFRF